MLMLSNAGILIAGGGIIGLSAALELRERGAQVTLLERAPAGARTPGQASWAAAGMLAANDPHNAPELHELSALSIGLYDGYLARVQRLARQPVSYQTQMTLQYLSGGEQGLLEERSIDPRQHMQTLELAVLAAGVDVRRGVEVVQIEESQDRVNLRAASGEQFTGAAVVLAAGAWGRPLLPVAPRKGQMLRVRIPDGESLDRVHRREDVYVVPRTSGPAAGTALVGATVEDAGFDTSIAPAALQDLRERAAELVGWVADDRIAPTVEAWGGLRPATSTGLPLMGLLPGSRRQIAATGHFRNGILQAPATAAIVADLLDGVPPSIDLTPFTPAR